MRRRGAESGLILGILVTALVSSASPRAAEAQPAQRHPVEQDPRIAEAKRLFDEGADRYTRGDYEAAIAAWEKAYALSRRPLILESVANAYERLGKPKKAREYLASWRAEAPADEHAVLDARLKKLDERIANEDADEARRRAEDAALAAPAAPDVRRPARSPASAPPPPPSSPVLGYVLGGVGLAAVGVGGTLDLLAASRRPDPAAACFDARGQRLCRISARDDIESSNALAIAGDTTWITGTVVFAAGLGLVLRSVLAGSSARVTAHFGPGAAGFGVSSEF